MNALAKNIARFVSSIIVSSILLQQFPTPLLAQDRPTTSVVNIVNLTETNGNVAVAFSPLAEGITITARVDQDGKGDFLSIASALAEIKNGVIAISTGTYNENNLLIPDNVIVQGGYDNTNWQRDPSNVTTVVGSSGQTTFVLQRASALQNIVVRTAKTGVRIAAGPATLSKITIADTKTAIEMSPHAETRLQNSNLVNNEEVISAHATSKIFGFNSIFQNNTVIANAPLENTSFIKDSSFFPNKSSLQNVRDDNNTVESIVPLAGAEWQFPETNNGTDSVASFDFTNIRDTEAKTIAGPSLTSNTGINALLLFYQLPEGDELRIVDRSNFSNVVYESTGQERQFRDWIAVPSSTEISLLLDLNGDNNVPLQVGISQSASIPELHYTTSLQRGMLADSPEANLFYRGTAQEKTDTSLNPQESQKLKDILSPVILAGEDWLKGASLENQNKQDTFFYKGFLNKILLTRGTTIYSASSNLEDQPQSSDDKRFFSLLSDFIGLERPTLLPLDRTNCTTLIQCPFGSGGITKALSYHTFSFRQATPGITSELGVFNNDGWNIQAGTDASLTLELPKTFSDFTAHWVMQPFVTTPSVKSHMVTFGNMGTPNKDAISLYMLPTGQMDIEAYNSNGRLYRRSTSDISWTPGTKYTFTLNAKPGKASLVRDNSTNLWEENIELTNITHFKAGKGTGPEATLPILISDLFIWENDGNSRTFGTIQGNAISTSLAPNEVSLSGGVAFNTNTLCQANAIRLREGGSELASISGAINGSNCNLSLNMGGIPSAEAVIPVSELNTRLSLLWQWNPVSAQGTITLANQKGTIVSTLQSYTSAAISQPFGLRNVSLLGIGSLNNVILSYNLEPDTANYTLSRLINVERYEVLYSETEEPVRNGTASKVAVTVDELNANSTPEKIVSSLEIGKRYYFAVQAVLENGGTTQSSNIRNIQLTGANSSTSLEAATQRASNLPTTLSLQTNQNFLVAHAENETPNGGAVEGGNVLSGQLGETLTLTNGAPGKNVFTAWTLGKDMPVSTNTKPKHIYTIPGEYIISELRTLTNGTILKQFSFAAVGAPSSDQLKIVAETWSANGENLSANWTNKATGSKIPALIGVNEPIYLLGTASDVAGSTDNAYTWNYTVDWGDTTIDTSEGVKNAFNLTRLVGRQKEQNPLVHRYTNPGIYTIVSQVSDERGNVGFFENTVVVSKPEIYPQKITSLRGMSRLITISGGTAPYTVEYLDGSTQTFAESPASFSLPITDSGVVTVTDRFDNASTLEITITTSSSENSRELYLPSDRKLTVSPASTHVGEVITVQADGEEHLFALTTATLFHFGDTLPKNLGDQLPALDTPITFASTSTTKTQPFLNMGFFPAVLTAIDNQGRENKKVLFLEIEQARLGTQSNAGIVTGSIPAAMKSIPESVEIWQRNVESVKLASITPNENGRFIYFVPDDQPSEGLLSIRIKDQKGSLTSYTQNIGYNLRNRPEKIFGILETNSVSPLFSPSHTLATNALKPTFFGMSKNIENPILRIASENPTEYPLTPNTTGAWLVESTQELEEGNHTFSLLDADKTPISEYDFVVDRTAPKKPTITYASWSQISGNTEPFGYIGIAAIGNDGAEQYVQANAQGKFHVNFKGFYNRYVLAAADEAGNVSELVQITENEWKDQQNISWWQRLRPYILWTTLLLLAGGSISLIRRVKI